MKYCTKLCAAAMLLISAAVLLGGCFYIDADGYVGNGDIVTEERELADELTGIINRTSFDVVIDPDLEGKAVIEGESNLIELVELNQDGGVLTLQVRPGTSIMKLKRMEVRIPAINGGVIRSEGSGNITLQSGALTGQQFDIFINGSGDVQLDIETGALNISINGSGDADIKAEAETLELDDSGSGNTYIKGSAATLSVSLNGSGDFNGFDFDVDEADVNISGSGDANVSVSEKLTGSIGGSGNITYEGSPSVAIEDNGSGDVRTS